MARVIDGLTGKPYLGGQGETRFESPAGGL